MNGGNTQRGQADGFALEILPKLNDVKSRDNTITLLQYVVRFCILKFDNKKGSTDAFMPVPEPSDVEKSGHINFDELMNESKSLENHLKKIQNLRDKVLKDADSEHIEPFQTKMEKCLQDATGSLKDIEDLVEDHHVRVVVAQQRQGGAELLLGHRAVVVPVLALRVVGEAHELARVLGGEGQVAAAGHERRDELVLAQRRRCQSKRC